MNLADAKAKLPAVIRHVEGGGGRVVIVKRGKPVAVISRYARAKDEGHWLERVRGLLRGDDEFGRVLDDVVASRKRARPRKFDLDG
jgi:prevent-host-death family protein